MNKEERNKTFKEFQDTCSCYLKYANTCNYTNKLCSINSCHAFKSRYLDFVPVCRIPGRMNCTIGFNDKDWKPGDCHNCEVAKKYENPTKPE